MNVLGSELTTTMPWIDRPEADIAARLAASGRSYGFDMAAKLADWRRDGFVIFEQVVDHATIDAYLEEMRHLREHHNRYVVSLEVRGTQTWTPAVPAATLEGAGVKFNHLHTSSLHAAKLSLTREVTEFLAAVFEAPVTPMQSLTFWMGSQQPTHIDYPYVCVQRRLGYMAASWIPLEDVHEDAGPLAYFPGAHRPEVSGFFDWGHGDILSRNETRVRNGMDFAHFLDAQMQAQGIPPKVFLPRKGDVLIWHANMPHAGLPVRDPKRTRKS